MMKRLMLAGVLLAPSIVFAQNTRNTASTSPVANVRMLWTQVRD